MDKPKIDILDMPENPTPTELGAWAASLDDLPHTFSLGLVREMFKERRAARLREVAASGGANG